MLLLASGADGDRENRADLSGSGGAEGDRTPDLMSAIQMPVRSPLEQDFTLLRTDPQVTSPIVRALMCPRKVRCEGTTKSAGIASTPPRSSPRLADPGGTALSDNKHLMSERLPRWREISANSTDRLASKAG